MHTVSQKIGEMDVVSLRRPVGKWPAGTIGTAIEIEGDAALVEIESDRGKLLGLPTVPLADLQFVEKYPFEEIFKDYLRSD